MSVMKNLAVQISTMVFHRRMKNEEILTSLRIPPESRAWALEQINAVRADPGTFKQLAGSFPVQAVVRALEERDTLAKMAKLHKEPNGDT